MTTGTNRWMWIQKLWIKMCTYCIMNSIMYVGTLRQLEMCMMYLKVIKLISCAMCMIFHWFSSIRLEPVDVWAAPIWQSAIKTTIMLVKYNESLNCTYTPFKPIGRSKHDDKLYRFHFRNHPWVHCCRTHTVYIVVVAAWITNIKKCDICELLRTFRNNW